MYIYTITVDQPGNLTALHLDRVLQEVDDSIYARGEKPLEILIEHIKNPLAEMPTSYLRMVDMALQQERKITAISFVREWAKDTGHIHSGLREVKEAVEFYDENFRDSSFSPARLLGP